MMLKILEISQLTKLFKNSASVKRSKPLMTESVLIPTWKLQSESFKNLKEEDKALSEASSSINSEINSKKTEPLKLKMKRNKELSLSKSTGGPFWEEDKLINSEKRK
jgi:hypothetical protein